MAQADETLLLICALDKSDAIITKRPDEDAVATCPQCGQTASLKEATLQAMGREVLKKLNPNMVSGTRKIGSNLEVTSHPEKYRWELRAKR